MAQFWYKKDKRILRISEDNNDRDVIKKIAELKDNGYVQVSERGNPEGSIIEKPKPKAKPVVKKAKPKAKAKKK
tara:strand:+ start:119 stop:340 length:222 start_codon:yes stop_codon:yes gene_type:complete